MTQRMVGVDVGGTFTDVFVLDGVSGAIRTAKVPTTRHDHSEGMLAGLAAVGLLDGDASIDATMVLIHGTTVGTNAILERTGARCGLLTTRGFRDVLELGRRTRPHAYGLAGTFEPLIPRDLRLEVTERIDAAGQVVLPLAEDEVRDGVRSLLAAGVEAIVIHFLHSYANPAHERRAVEIARELWPDGCISAGTEILPEVREYERGTTAALNAYIQPLVLRYLERLERRLQSTGRRDELLVMQSSGGMMAAALVREHAIQTALSGPAACALAAARIAVAAGYPHAISCDMGGTSFDVALIRDGAPAVSSEKELAYGLPIRIPMIDITTIGAGGGSIARIDDGGMLQVGPASAGAVPGPICYGRGGRDPTVTDAHVVLGRIKPAALAATGNPVDRDAVAQAIADRIGGPLGLGAAAAAAAILDVTANQLAGAIRLVSIEKGHDPRDVVLVACGGAGPLHAVALARELGIPTVLVPLAPGLASALGCALADVRHDFVQTVNVPLLDADPETIDAIFARQREEGQTWIAREQIPLASIEATHEADLLYSGQSHLFRVPVESPGFDPALVASRFAEHYRERFAIELPEMRAVLVNLRTAVTGRRPPFDLRMLASLPSGRLADACTETRTVAFDGSWHNTPIYRRERLPDGVTIAGPAIVEQTDATTVIDPGAMARVDAFGNLIITVLATGKTGHDVA